MKQFVLAGDVGGTKTDLALYRAEPEGIVLEREETVPSAGFRRFGDLLKKFLGDSSGVVAAAFGLPGPVIDGRVQTVNLPWEAVDPVELAREIGCPRVRLMNDLETTALGALHLPADELLVLNSGVERKGSRAVIAAGTGLGQAFLFWNGKYWEPSATEGGHTDFGPHGDLEDGLLRFLRAKFGEHVSYERIVSGPGLKNVFDYLDQDRKRPVAEDVRRELAGAADASAVIGGAAVAGTCVACRESLELFVRIYGAQAGNLALTVMATGGVYVGGGIVTKILPMMKTGAFVDAFTNKGRYRKLLSEIPVKVILNARASRIGAAMAARSLLEPA